MAQQNDSQLIVSADVIKNETVANANTATRVGDMLNDIIDSKINNDKIDVDGTLTADSDDLVASQKAIKAYVDSAKSTDVTLGGATPSDSLFPSQKAVKDYVDNAPSLTKVYRARIDMLDGDVQTVFENTLGVTLTWSVLATGQLTTGTVTGLIGQNNVFCQISSNVSGGGNFPYITSISFAPSPWRIDILQADETGALVSDQQVFVEIVIYP
jgi:hypothetical protein